MMPNPFSMLQTAPLFQDIEKDSHATFPLLLKTKQLWVLLGLCQTFLLKRQAAKGWEYRYAMHIRLRYNPRVVSWQPF